MSKETKSYKVSSEFKAKLESLFLDSGFDTQEAFLEHVAILYEMQQLKNGMASGYQKQIDELEYHSRRNVELFLGMLETESDTRMQLTQDHEDSISQRAETIMGQEREITRLEKELFQTKEQLAQTNKENDSLIKHIEQQQEISKKDNLLVEEYKSKLDTLTGLVNEYKKAADENQELKSELNHRNLVQKELTKDVVELKAKLEDKDAALKKYIDEMEIKINSDQERLAERKDIEKERELLKLRTEYQEKLEQSQTETTAKIRELYEQIEKLRQQHEKEIEILKQGTKEEE